MWKWIKWIGAAVMATGGIILAFLYGKKTPAVHRQRVRAIEAKEAILRHQKEIHLAEAEKAGEDEKGKLHIAKADTLTIKLEDVRKKKEEALSQTGDLTDDELAALDNARRSRTGSSAG